MTSDIVLAPHENSLVWNVPCGISHAIDDHIPIDLRYLKSIASEPLEETESFISKTFRQTCRNLSDREIREYIENCVRCFQCSEREALGLLNMIKQENFLQSFLKEEGDSWLNVGEILFDIGQGHKKALNMWIEFSANIDHSAKECEDRWKNMRVDVQPDRDFHAQQNEEDADVEDERTEYNVDLLTWD